MEPHWLNGRWMAIWTSKKKKKKRKRLIHRIINIHGFPSGTSGKGPACQCRRHKKLMGSIRGSGRFPGGGHGNWFQYSCLENPREPGGLQSIGSERVGHDWNDLAGTNESIGIHWRWQGWENHFPALEMVLHQHLTLKIGKWSGGSGGKH